MIIVRGHFKVIRHPGGANLHLGWYYFFFVEMKQPSMMHCPDQRMRIILDNLLLISLVTLGGCIVAAEEFSKIANLILNIVGEVFRVGL